LAFCLHIIRRFSLVRRTEVYLLCCTFAIRFCSFNIVLVAEIIFVPHARGDFVDFIARQVLVNTVSVG